MNNTNNEKLTQCSQKLRRNMTKEERHLWYDFLKKLPVTVHRQKTIGKYIVDFYIASGKIIIEIDGTQHFEDKGIAKDKIRDGFFENFGYTVLRYSNHEINNCFESVCEDILNKLLKPSP